MENWIIKVIFNLYELNFLIFCQLCDIFIFSDLLNRLQFLLLFILFTSNFTFLVILTINLHYRLKHCIYTPAGNVCFPNGLPCRQCECPHFNFRSRQTAGYLQNLTVMMYMMLGTKENGYGGSLWAQMNDRSMRQWIKYKRTIKTETCLLYVLMDKVKWIRPEMYRCVANEHL